MFKTMRLVIVFDMFLNHIFKLTTNFANIAGTTDSKVNLHTRKDSKSSETESLYEKQFLILNEVKTNLMLTFSLQNSLQNFKRLFLI